MSDLKLESTSFLKVSMVCSGLLGLSSDVIKRHWDYFHLFCYCLGEHKNNKVKYANPYFCERNSIGNDMCMSLLNKRIEKNSLSMMNSTF